MVINIKTPVLRAIYALAIFLILLTLTSIVSHGSSDYSLSWQKIALLNYSLFFLGLPLSIFAAMLIANEKLWGIGAFARIGLIAITLYCSALIIGASYALIIKSNPHFSFAEQQEQLLFRTHVFAAGWFSIFWLVHLIDSKKK